MQQKNPCILLMQRQLRSSGHWLRKENSSIKKCALYATNRGTNRRGRPKHTYIKLTLQTTGLWIEEMKVKAMD